jgi:thiol-disulfide isomerase/thioredoxin
MNKLEYYTAEWCGPCAYMEERVRQIAELKKLELEELDVEQHKDLASTRKVTAIPQLILLNEDDEVLHRFIGIHEPKDMRKVL